MVLKQGERAKIEQVVGGQKAEAARALSFSDTKRRIETTNLLAGKADITVTDALDARLTAAEADAVALEARVDANETNLISQAAVDVDHETRIAAAETAIAANEWAAVPASAGASGIPGQLAYEPGFFYVCVAADTWQRVAIATWP
jgi:hypothetical protein